MKFSSSRFIFVILLNLHLSDCLQANVVLKLVREREINEGNYSTLHRDFKVEALDFCSSSNIFSNLNLIWSQNKFENITTLSYRLKKEDNKKVAICSWLNDFTIGCPKIIQNQNEEKYIGKFWILDFKPDEMTSFFSLTNNHFTNDTKDHFQEECERKMRNKFILFLILIPGFVLLSLTLICLYDWHVSRKKNRIEPFKNNEYL